jgi:N-methylhydantoinase B
MSNTKEVRTGSKAITAELVRSHISSAAEEMRRALVRTAFNPVIYDVLDFGISIYDSKLELIAEAPGVPSFIGANDYAIVKAVEHVGEDRLEKGDILLMNYPYWNSAHTYDATLFAPVYFGSKLIGYEVIRAHWMDLGAKDPGYVLDSTDMHQEGIIFPGTKVVKKGMIDEEILDILRFNSRMPEEIIGDLNAQISSIRTGERRLEQIISKFGYETFRDSIEILLSAGERASYDSLEKLPEGSWSAEDYLDDDGISDELIPMKATVTIRHDEFKVDFTGSSPMVRGPVNMPLGATYSTCKIVFKSITTPYAPSNGGNYRMLKVYAPEGSLFNATYPSPTFTLWTGIVALELVYKAVAQAISERMSASSGGDLPGFMMVGVDKRTGRLYAISNNEPVGWGASSGHDGSNALEHHSVCIGRNTPIEVLEMKSGMMVEYMKLRTDSGGPGKFRGGLGVERKIRFVEEGEFLTVMKKSKTRNWGLNGGYPSEPSGMYIYPGTPNEKRVGTYRMKVRPGDECIIITAGGGGYGIPTERDPALVLEDVLDGYVSIESAETVYHVAIRDGKIDWDRTREIRGKVN